MALFTDLLAAGLCPIPIRLDGSKAPAIRNWREFQSRLPTPQQAADWDREHRAVAVICGEISGNLELIDVDEPALVRPFLSAVKQEAPDLYRQLTLHRTPRRNESGQAGCHVLYRCPNATISGNAKLAMSEPEPQFDDEGEPVLDQAGEQRKAPRALIETRGTGGYFVTVGSAPEAHPSGRSYEHAHGPELASVEAITPEQRDLLLAIAKTYDRSVAETHVDPQPEGYLRQDDRPGEIYADRTSWADILDPAGGTKVGEAGGITRWRQPGKSQGWSATTGILSKAGHELLCVFSSNAHPFPGPSAGSSCSTHSKFDAYAILNHSGDHREAAKALAGLGYGEPPRKKERQQRVMVQTLQQLEIELLANMSAGYSLPRSTGITLLDEALQGGVEPGEVVLIGGPTSHGKTVLAMQLARNDAEAGRNVIIVSEEMSGMALAKRSLQSRVFLPPDEWPAVQGKIADESSEYWSKAGRVFVLEICRTMDRVEQAVKQITDEYDIGTIVLDYAQLITAPGKSLYEQITETSSRFAAIVRKHRMIGVLLAQYSKEGANARDILAFKGSTQLPQDADVILKIEWPAKEKPGHPRPRQFNVGIAKNRNRAVVHREIELEFRPEIQTITSPPPRNYTNEFDEWNERKDL